MKIMHFDFASPEDFLGKTNEKRTSIECMIGITRQIRVRKRRELLRDCCQRTNTHDVCGASDVDLSTQNR